MYRDGDLLNTNVNNSVK